VGHARSAVGCHRRGAEDTGGGAAAALQHQQAHPGGAHLDAQRAQVLWLLRKVFRSHSLRSTASLRSTTAYSSCCSSGRWQCAVKACRYKSATAVLRADWVLQFQVQCIAGERMKGATVPLRGADDRPTFRYRVARMVTSPISATVSRSIWNYKSHAQTYLQHFPQLVVRKFERTSCNNEDHDCVRS